MLKPSEAAKGNTQNRSDSVIHSLTKSDRTTMIPMTDGAADLLFSLALPFILDPTELECWSTCQQLTTA